MQTCAERFAHLRLNLHDRLAGHHLQGCSRVGMRVGGTENRGGHVGRQAAQGRAMPYGDRLPQQCM
jgi:hypothetical protein